MGKALGEVEVNFPFKTYLFTAVHLYKDTCKCVVGLQLIWKSGFKFMTYCIMNRDIVDTV